ncbi:MAG: FlgO family outer membrane protein [Candidatus Nitrospinota bacterium M3_3B_026]
MKAARLIAGLLFAAAALSGCAGLAAAPKRAVGPAPDDQFGAMYLAYTIKGQLRHREVMDQPIVVTTFVDLNNLARSSVFGRVLAEKLLTELHLAGFTVSEIRKGRDIFIRKELGELILSRDSREILGKSRARAALAGTYVATEDSVIVNARLIDVGSPLILSSCSYNLPMTGELQKLLTGEAPF